MKMRTSLDEMSSDLAAIAANLERIAGALDTLVAPLRWATTILARMGN